MNSPSSATSSALSKDQQEDVIDLTENIDIDIPPPTSPLKTRSKRKSTADVHNNKDHKHSKSSPRSNGMKRKEITTIGNRKRKRSSSSALPLQKQQPSHKKKNKIPIDSLQSLPVPPPPAHTRRRRCRTYYDLTNDAITEQKRSTTTILKGARTTSRKQQIHESSDEEDDDESDDDYFDDEDDDHDSDHEEDEWEQKLKEKQQHNHANHKRTRYIRLSQQQQQQKKKIMVKKQNKIQKTKSHTKSSSSSQNKSLEDTTDSTFKEPPSSVVAATAEAKELYQFQNEWEKGVQRKSSQPPYRSEYWTIWKRTTKRTCPPTNRHKQKKNSKKQTKIKNKKKSNNKIVQPDDGNKYNDTHNNNNNHALLLNSVNALSFDQNNSNNTSIIIDFSTVHKIALSKLVAGMHYSAFQFCHDVIWNWTQQVQEQQGHLYRCHPHFVAISTSSSQSASSAVTLSNIAKLRTGIAGMWCVYVHLLMEYTLILQRSQKQQQKQPKGKTKGLTGVDTTTLPNASSTTRKPSPKRAYRLAQNRMILPFRSRSNDRFNNTSNDEDSSGGDGGELSTGKKNQHFQDNDTRDKDRFNNTTNDEDSSGGGGCESSTGKKNQHFQDNDTRDKDDKNISASTSIRYLLEYTDWVLERVTYSELVGNHPWVSLVRSRLVVLQFILFTASDQFNIKGADKLLCNEIDEWTLDLGLQQQPHDRQQLCKDDLRMTLQNVISHSIAICSNGVHNCRTMSATLPSQTPSKNQNNDEHKYDSPSLLTVLPLHTHQEKNSTVEKTTLFANALCRLPSQQMGQSTSTSTVMKDPITSQALKESLSSVTSLLPERPEIYMFVDEPQSLARERLILCHEMNRLTQIQQKMKEATSITVTREYDSVDDGPMIHRGKKEEGGDRLETLYHFGMLHLKPNHDTSMIGSTPVGDEIRKGTSKKLENQDLDHKEIYEKNSIPSCDKLKDEKIPNADKMDSNGGEASTFINITDDASDGKENKKPGSACFAVEYVCCNCTTATFPSKKECQHHEETCKGPKKEGDDAIKMISNRDFDKLPKQSLHFSGAGRHLINLNSSFTGSFNPEQRVGLEVSDLLNLLDYAVEFFVVGKTELNQVKSLRTNKSSMVTMGVNERTGLQLSQDVPYFAGQVGLRCLFCRAVGARLEEDHQHDYPCSEILPGVATPAARRPLFGESGSFRFPKTRRFLHKDIWMLCLTHMDTCENMPLVVKRRYMEFRDTVRMDSPIFEEYWHDAGSFLSSKRDGNGVFWQRLVPTKHNDDGSVERGRGK